MREIKIKAKFWNYLNYEKVIEGELLPIEIKSKIDNGATLTVIPEKLAKKLNLPVIKKIKVKYADERYARKYTSFVGVEIQGRHTIVECVIEPKRKIPLIGAIALENMDWWIDSKKGRLIPNPESPKEPLYELEENRR